MKTIILVDDDTAIRHSFSLMLDREKFELKSYSNGLKIFHQEVEVPDLFILDWKIAGINGLDLCRFIRRSDKYAQVPVIMISGSPDIGTLAAGAGAADTISKPYTVSNAREVINRYTS